MSDEPATIISVNISPGGIPKLPIDSGQVTMTGIAGDAHDHEKHNTPLQALCLIDAEDLDDLRREGFPVLPGTVGENLTITGLDVDRLGAGVRLRCSGGVEMELTKRRKPCYVLDAISPELKQAIVDRCGMYARVVREGVIQPGETIELIDGDGAEAPRHGSDHGDAPP
jgi:MOSC domain-containing protein YiiM